MKNNNTMGQRLIISEEEKRNIQKMYGMINEESSSETLNKDEENNVEDKVANELLPSIENLTPEQINQLKSELEHLGVTPDSSVKDVINNIKDISDNIESSLNEDEKTTKEKIADTLSDVGSALMSTLLVPVLPVIIGNTTGTGFAGGLAINVLTAYALMSLAKALGKKEGSTEHGNY